MFYDRFLELCKQKDIAPSRAAIDAGISKSLVSKWKSNEAKEPSPEVVRKLADYFGISTYEVIEAFPWERTSVELEAFRHEKTPIPLDESSSVYGKISLLCEKHNTSVYRLCKDIGITPSVMTDLKIGRRQNLDSESTEKIATHFSISAEHLVGAENKETASKEGSSPDLSGAYFRLGKKAQELNLEINDDDIDAILKIYQIHKKLNEE